MNTQTITNKDELQSLIEQNPLVLVAALEAHFQPGEMEFDRIARANGQSNVVFAKFLLEESPELAAHFEIHDIATIITFIGGQKGETVTGSQPPRWEEMVREVIGMQ